MELEELRETNLKEGEDEELFTEYSLLANADELASRVNEIMHALTGEKQPVLVSLNRQKSHFEQLVRMDSTLVELAKSYENALLELQEVAYTLQRYQSGIEHNPTRMDFINERLALINRLKRKYGQTVTEIKAYQKKAEAKLLSLESIDAQIDDLKQQLLVITEHNRQLSEALSNKRNAAAKRLEVAVVEQLRALNMPKVDFHCLVTSQKCNKWGENKIEFFLSPNVGERQVPIKDCASGGELSRVMLALQVLLAGKECIPTLIFDEIDANIGGETASIVGEKLRDIASKHQVLCITHFAQVAKQAHHHLQVSKQEQAERTFSTVKILGKKERQLELQRMQGGN
jgi:DNA repair protein RecN (Recombination protein N)